MEVIHRRCSGLDVHKETVVACVRLALDGEITREVRTFETTTSGLLLLLAWLTELGCTHVAMEATGVYWKPVWQTWEGHFQLILANPYQVKNIPGEIENRRLAFKKQLITNWDGYCRKGTPPVALLALMQKLWR